MLFLVPSTFSRFVHWSLHLYNIYQYMSFIGKYHTEGIMYRIYATHHLLLSIHFVLTSVNIIFFLNPGQVRSALAWRIYFVGVKS